MARLFIAGATGLVGGHALALALADARVTHVIAPTRRPLAMHPKLVNPIVSSLDLPLDADGWHVDGAICALGTTRARAGSAAAFHAIDHDYALMIATAVRRGGAGRFALTSSMGADAQSRLLYPRTKGQLEQAVRGLGFASLTLVRPGLLGGSRSEMRVLERIAGIALRIAKPILPAAARISPAHVVAAILVDAAIAGAEGTHIVTSADIAATNHAAVLHKTR